MAAAQEGAPRRDEREGSDGAVTVHVDGGVALVTLRRAHKLNALSREMELLLLDALDSPEVRGSACVVLTGEGRAFSAGADLDDFSGLDADELFADLEGAGRAYETFARMAQPTIAAISGWCLGGGMEMALGADIRIADDTAVFDLPEVRYGVVTSGAAYRLTRLVGPSRAKELLLFRRRISAAEALGMGLVSEVVPASGLLERAKEIGRSVASLPEGAARRAKALVDLVLDAPRDVAVALEQAHYVALSQTAAGRSPRRREG